MRKIGILLTALSLIVTIAWYEPAAAEPATEKPMLEEKDPQAKLRDTVEGWISAIAEEHKFLPWQNADYHIEPLGPGTHGWLVHVLDQHTPVGYLIVDALQDGGYRLAEYGVGERPIFHIETLRTSLVQHGMIESVTTMDDLKTALTDPARPGHHNGRESADDKTQQLVIERHYLYPFAAYWKVSNKASKQTAYFDAVTGEQYPLVKDPAKNPPTDGDIDYQPTRLAKLKDRMQLPKFDPYEDLGWIIEEPLRVQSINDVIDPLRDKQRMTLTVELYEDMVLLPYPIIGYAEWEMAEAYLLLYSEGLRYVPLIDAVQYGRIYLEQD